MEWTHERGKEARARCDAATEGPWDIFHICSPAGESHRIYADCKDGDIAHIPKEWRARNQGNGPFIAHARTDLPDALDEIERLKKVEVHVARLRSAVATVLDTLSTWDDSKTNA